MGTENVTQNNLKLPPYSVALDFFGNPIPEEQLNFPRGDPNEFFAGVYDFAARLKRDARPYEEAIQG